MIEAFDACLDYVYGRRYGRDNPHKSDAETAERWINAGLTVPVACFVFFRQMNVMHEKWLRDDLRERSHFPHSLKLFDENMEAAIRRAHGDEVTTWDMEESKWRSRLKGWKRNPTFWNVENWGPRPDQPGCRAPRSLLAEAA
jgi:hypothetical protein